MICYVYCPIRFAALCEFFDESVIANRHFVSILGHHSERKSSMLLKLFQIYHRLCELEEAIENQYLRLLRPVMTKSSLGREGLVVIFKSLYTAIARLKSTNLGEGEIQFRSFFQERCYVMLL